MFPALPFAFFPVLARIRVVLWWTLARTTREQTKKSTAVQVLLDNKNKENYGTVVVSEVGPDVFATQKHKNK